MLDPTKRVPAVGPRNAKIMIVGMAPAVDEVRLGIPFVGRAGQCLNSILRQIGLSRDAIFITNIVHFPIIDSLYNVPLDLLTPELERLKREIEEVKPNVIIALGEEPLYYLTGKHGITKWRGSILPCTLVNGYKCVVTFHPAWIIRGMWKWFPIVAHIDFKRAIEESHTRELVLPKREAITGPSFNTAMDYIHECNKHEYLAIDIETMWWKKTAMGEIACIGLGYRPDQAICIPMVRGNGQNYWTEHEEVLVWRAIAELLQNKRVKKIAQNAPFEWIYFWYHKIYPWPLFIDTMTLHHCLYPDFGAIDSLFRKREPDNPGHGLAFINSMYTRTPYYKDDGRAWLPGVGDHQFWNYNCMDVMVTFEAAFAELTEVREEGLWDFYQLQYIRPFAHALRMEWFGTPIDVTLRAQAGRELETRVVELQRMIDAAVGYHLNVRSPQQMNKLLYQEKGYQIRKNRKTGKATTDKNTLAYFAGKNGDLALKLIMDLKQAQDTISDVINQPLDERNYIHTHFNIGGTDGLRWSSSKSILGSGTNLQNLPRGGIARRLFTANPCGGTPPEALSAWECALRPPSAG